MGIHATRMLRSPLATVGAVLVSAVAYAAAFPPNAQRWLAWGALVPLFVALRRGSLGSALGLTWMWTIVMAYRLNDWFPRAVADYFGQGWAIGFILFLGVSTFTGGLEYMGFAALYRRAVRWTPALRPLLVAAAWVSVELGRVKLLGGDPWALLGYSQADVLPLVQIADLTGVYGTTFALAAVNAAVAEIVTASASERRRAGTPLAGVLAVVLLVVAYGTVRLGEADETTARAPVEVAVVQANLDVGSQWREEFYGRNLDAYLALTRASLAKHPVPLVVWPENAMTFFVDTEPEYRRHIARTLGPAVELIAGGPRREGPEQHYNSAFLLTPGGEVGGWYDKQFLLPFAEYFPGSLDLVRRRFARVRRFTPGAPRVPLPSVAGPAGVLICNEAMFPEPAARHAHAGATWLVNLANDSWLAAAKFSEPTFDMARLRAIEQRRYVVRASTAGPSAIVDPFGRVLARTASAAADTVTGAVVPMAGLTLYARVGDAFAFGCLAITLAAALGWFTSRAGASSSRGPSA